MSGQLLAARRAAAALLAASVPLCAQAQEGAAPRTALKVCSDPNSLPQSNEKGEGYENRIAQVLAKDLNLPLTYYWFPNRMNFVRNTLRYKLPTEDYPCDLIIGVPAEFDQVSVTKPYFRSTYAIVYRKGKGLDGVKTSDDLLALPPARLEGLRIGLYDKSPASLWLARHNLVDHGAPYGMMNADPDYFPGQDIERDLGSGKIGAAILWGPIAGNLLKRGKVPDLVLAPMKSDPGLPLDYAIAMGVRYGEPQWKKQVEDMIGRHQGDIKAILAEYRIPLVDAPAAGGSQ